MSRYEYVTIHTGGGFLIDNSTAEHRDIINEYAAKGRRFVGHVPTMFTGNGGLKEIDLTFEIEEP